jgi:Cof subfamily protein (haloacid dehalogenase superfamily)
VNLLGCFDGILLATDIDGTLVGAGGIIPNNNFDAIAYFVSNGGLFTVATGRAISSAAHFFPPFPFSVPWILCNGAVIYDYSKQLNLRCLHLPNEARSVLEQVLNTVPNIGAEVYVGTDIYIVRYNQMIWRQITYEDLKVIDCDVKNVPDGWHKAVLIGDQTAMRAAIDCVNKLNNGTISFQLSGCEYYEMVAKGCNKGVGLKELKKHLERTFNLKLKTAAIGDYYNDYDMLKFADFPAAPSNSAKELKEIAHFITCNNNDGCVAEFIEKLETAIKNQP